MKNIGRILIVLIASAIGLCIPSGLVAAGAYFMGKNVWASFFIAAGVTAVIGWLWNMSLSLRARVAFEAIEAQNRLADAYQNIETSCAYCNARNVIRIALGKNNNFTCKNCNNKNTVDIQFGTSRTTTPLIADNVINEAFEKISNEPSPQKQSTVNTSKIEITGSKNE